jgi:hypothetical protein
MTQDKKRELVERIVKKHNIVLSYEDKVNEYFGTEFNEPSTGEQDREVVRAFFRMYDPNLHSPRDLAKRVIENIVRTNSLTDEEIRLNRLQNGCSKLMSDLWYLHLDFIAIHKRKLTKEEYESTIVRKINGQDGMFGEALFELLKESRRSGYKRTVDDYPYENLHGGYYPSRNEEESKKVYATKDKPNISTLDGKFSKFFQRLSSFLFRKEENK